MLHLSSEATQRWPPFEGSFVKVQVAWQVLNDGHPFQEEGRRKVCLFYIEFVLVLHRRVVPTSQVACSLPASETICMHPAT